MKEKKKVIVIGAGVAGLTASIELLHHGYDVFLYEKNKYVGGLCTGFEVKGHYIDACYHWMVGTGENNKFNRIHKQNQALRNKNDVVELPTLGTYTYEGQSFTFYKDIDKTEKEWIEKAPEDVKAIKRFMKTIKTVGELIQYSDKVEEKKKLTLIKKFIKATPRYHHILQSMRISRDEYAKKFKNKSLQFAIKNLQFGFSSMFFVFVEYGMYVMGNVALPKGGPLPMITRMKDEFIRLGGHLYLDTEVDEILAEKDKVVGVKIRDEILTADYYMSCVDPTHTFNVLFKGKYQDKKLNKLYKHEHKNKISTCYNVFYAIDADLKSMDIPCVPYVKPFKVGERNVDFLLVRPYHMDDVFIQNGKTILSVLIDQDTTDYKYWEKLSKEEHKRIKDELSEKVKEQLEELYPFTKGKIESLISFSPIDFYEATYSSYGAVLSFGISTSYLNGKKSYRHDKLKNFYYATQWSAPMGGTSIAIYHAYQAAKELEKKAK